MARYWLPCRPILCPLRRAEILASVQRLDHGTTGKWWSRALSRRYGFMDPNGLGFGLGGVRADQIYLSTVPESRRISGRTKNTKR